MLPSILFQQEYRWLDSSYRSMDKMPEQTLKAYEAWGAEARAGGEPQVLTYMGVPHVFVKGAIPVDDLKVIKVK